jgi:GT2 family glycosyltransferase
MQLDLSVIVVSFNTRDVLRRSLEIAIRELENLRGEILVVDNQSSDGSAEMVARDFPSVRLIVSDTNLGFAGANNVAFREARGRFFILLNSDAFLEAGSLSKALKYGESDPTLGCGGAKLIGRDGSWQPSQRSFPSLLNKFLMISGLSAKYPGSKFFGRVDKTWADDNESADADWVPGAFAILPRAALETVGFFDEDFFLYYEEVDLCRRLRLAGYRVRYLPDIRVVHIGGESARAGGDKAVSEAGSQITLWRLRSEFLYYRKHHGGKAFLAMWLERNWNLLRSLKMRLQNTRASTEKRLSFDSMIHLIDQAWHETCGGRVSPPRPW